VKSARFHAKNFGKIHNFHVGCRAAASFDVGDDVAIHATPQQLHFGGELFSRPIFAAPKPDYVSSNEIFHC
jgi:hypothetical protein